MFRTSRAPIGLSPVAERASQRFWLRYASSTYGKRATSILAILSGLVACTENATPPGPADAAIDVGAADVSFIDAEPTDALPRDIHVADAVADASVSDVPDGSAPDADIPDAAPIIPEIDDPGPQTVNEYETLQLQLTTRGSAQLRVHALGIPEGALWDEDQRTLTFTPDFIQGGRTWDVRFIADDGVRSAEQTVSIEAVDTVSPPEPTVVSTEMETGYMRIELSQVTDDFLDSPGFAGRTFTANVMASTDATPDEPLPIRVRLHGFGASRPSSFGWRGEFRIAAHDPDNTYWYGYSSSLPDAAPQNGTLTDYTQRRVLHLLDWVLKNFDGADIDRVYANGSSMGGAGAATMGLTYARHFACIDSTIGQNVPRNHRPSRTRQLENHWGPSGPTWNVHDLTRVLMESVEARNQLMFMKHGKDDPVIHFGAVVQGSPLTNLSFYSALQSERVGHLVAWDEGGHGINDPVLGGTWWHSGWNPIFDDTTKANRKQAFVAFSGASHDADPGDGGGNGMQPWSDNSGFAGRVVTAGDTGWNGDIAGTFNRLLRWDSNGIVDSVDRFSIPLRVLDGEGADPPEAGYPYTGDRLGVTPPVMVDVTPRRVQAFLTKPGEEVEWSFGTQSGTVVAASDGSITVVELPLTTDWQVLELSRIY